MSKSCDRCKDLHDDKHHRNHTKLCDACYIDIRIRQRVKEQTSYNGHLHDIELLLDKYDYLIEKLEWVNDRLIDLEPGGLMKIKREIIKIVSIHKSIEKM